MMQCGFFVAIGACDVGVITHHDMASAIGGRMIAPDESIFLPSAQQCESLAWLQVAHIIFHFWPLMSFRLRLAYK